MKLRESKVSEFGHAYWASFRVSLVAAVLPTRWALPDDVPLRRCTVVFGSTTVISMILRVRSLAEEALGRATAGMDVPIDRSP